MASKKKKVKNPIWVVRLKREREEFLEKSLTLKKYLSTKVYQTLPIEQRELLSVQHDVMLTYIHVLDNRLNAHYESLARSD